MSTRFGETGQYNIIRKLGQGGMGAVFLAEDEERGFHVALKTLIDTDPKYRHRLKNEFRALSDIVHPNLVRFYELNTIGEHWFITMEYIDGVSLLSYVRPESTSPLNPATFLNSQRDMVPQILELEPDRATRNTRTLPKLFDLSGASITYPTTAGESANYERLRESLVALCLGLESVHAAGKLHRDIKPSNVLVGDNQRVVLLDFGLVVEYMQPNKHDVGRGAVIGTVEYMSPEQALGKPLTPASDWYSVGVLLFEALTGRLPLSGDPAAVLYAKKNFRPVQPTVLNAEIPADLSQLCVDLLSSDPNHRPAGPTIRHLLQPVIYATHALVPRPLARMPFVGRRDQLKTLSEAFSSVQRSQQPAWIYVSGRSGMGKTALINAFLNTLNADSSPLVFTGRCHQRESVPFKALDGLIDSIVNHLSRLPSALADDIVSDSSASLVRVFPAFAQLLDVPPHEDIDVPALNISETRRIAFLALIKILQRLAEENTIVIAIDDLQWGDLDSTAFFLSLFRAITPFPLLFVGAYRAEETTNTVLEPLLTATITNPHKSKVVVVDALSDEESQALARQLLAAPSPEVDLLAAKIATEAAGSPYFVAELAASRLENRDTGSWSLDDMLHDRIRVLPKSAQALLHVISVAGGPLLLGPAFAAAGLSAKQVEDLLPMLQNQRLIRVSGSRQNDWIETFHDRIRETVIAHLPPEALARLHGTLATHLESIDEIPPEALIAHYQGARQHRKAAKYAIQTAHRALASSAFDQAARLYQLSLQLVADDYPDMQTLRVNLAEALSGAGRGREASTAYLKAASFSERHEALEYKRRASEALLFVGEFERGLRISKDVLVAVGGRLHNTRSSAIRSLAWQRLLLRLSGMKLKSHPTVSAEQILIAKTFTSLAMALSMVDVFAAAVLQTRALRLSLKLGDRDNAAVNLALESGFQACAGGKAKRRVKQLLKRAYSLVEGRKDPATLGMIEICRGIGNHLLGYWRNSVSACQRAVPLLRQCSHVHWAMCQTQDFQKASLYYLGDFAQAEQLIEQSAQLAYERNDLYLNAQMQSGYHPLMKLSQSDEPGAVRAIIREANDMWQTNQFSAISFYTIYANANCDLYEGKHDNAWEGLMSQWEEIHHSLLLRVELAGTEMYELRARCALALASEKKSRGDYINFARRDIRRFDNFRIGRPLALLLHAQLAWLEQTPSLTQSYLLQAITEFKAVDMAMYTAIAQHRLGALVAGDQGRNYTDAAHKYFAAHSIADVDRFLAMYSPAFARL